MRTKKPDLLRLGAQERKRLLAERGPRRDKEPVVSFPIGGPRPEWEAVADYVLRGGRPVIKALRIYPIPAPWIPYDIPPEGLTADDLRRIKIIRGGHLVKAMKLLFERAGIDTSPPVVRRRKQPGHYQRKDDDYYAEKAWECWEASIDTPRRPNVYLAEKYRKRGWDRVTPGTVAEWAREARRRGFLSKGHQGRAVSEPTEKLREWKKRRSRNQKPARPRGKE